MADPETSTTVSRGIAKKRKPPSSGIIYLQSVPYFFTAKRLRETLSPFGEVGKIYLEPEIRKNASGRKERHFIEGWVEFKDKQIAKRVAASLNKTPVGGKRRSKAFECLWNIKYLNRFKWVHLTEQLTYERAVHQQKMRAEISQAKRQANFFAQQVEKGDNLRTLEERVLKKGGNWEKYQRQIEQKNVITDDGKKTKDTDDIMNMIFAE